jgi:hypothetical protein
VISIDIKCADDILIFLLTDATETTHLNMTLTKIRFNQNMKAGNGAQRFRNTVRTWINFEVLIVLI